MRTLELVKSFEHSKLSPKEIFVSMPVRNCLQTVANIISQRYSRPLYVSIIYTEDKTIAATNNSKLVINSNNDLTNAIYNKFGLNMAVTSLIGLLGHELGHILYTDFQSCTKVAKAWSSKTWYPERPEFNNPRYEATTQIIENQVFGGNTKGWLSFFHEIENSLEDGFIEKKMSQYYEGTIKTGLKLLNDQMFCDENFDKSYTDTENNINKLLDFLLYDAKVGIHIKNPSTDLTAIYSYVDRCNVDTSAKERANLSIHLFIILATVLLEQKNISSDNKANATNKHFSDSEENISSDNKGGKIDLQEINQMIKKLLLITKNDNVHIIRNNKNDLDNNIADSESNNLTAADSLSCSKDITHASDVNPQVIDIDLSNVVQKALESSENTKLKEQLQNMNICEKIDDEAICHKNVPYKIDDYTNALPDKALYESMLSEIKPICTRLAGRIRDALADRSEGGERRDLLIGTKIIPASSAHGDGKIFASDISPEDIAPLTVALLIDQSGSMMGRKKIEQAKKTAIAVEYFCRMLNIPVSVIGHSEDYYGVILSQYVRFGHPEDRYTLPKIEAGGNNRDGFALRYVEKQIETRPEENKLVILISDGLPNGNDYGQGHYSGNLAYSDLAAIKLDMKKKGIGLVTAAIDSSKDIIQRIYGKDSFLDITDLNRLPITLTKIILQQLL